MALLDPRQRGQAVVNAGRFGVLGERGVGQVIVTLPLEDCMSVDVDAGCMTSWNSVREIFFNLYCLGPAVEEIRTRVQSMSNYPDRSEFYTHPRCLRHIYRHFVDEALKAGIVHCSNHTGQLDLKRCISLPSAAGDPEYARCGTHRLRCHRIRLPPLVMIINNFSSAFTFLLLDLDCIGYRGRSSDNGVGRLQVLPSAVGTVRRE